MVTLTVDILSVEPLPLVRIEVDADAAEAWKVVGRTDGGAKWLAGESIGPAVFSDPWAPLSVEVSYYVGAVESGPVVRPYRGQHVLTDLTGRRAADFLWEQAGGDSWGFAPRHSFLEVPGRALSPFVSAPTAGSGGGSLLARTVAPHTRAMSELVLSNKSLILLHNEARCPLRECDVPLARTILLTGAPADATGRMDRGERSWPLAYRLAPRPFEYLAPVATWADVSRAFPTFADVAATGMSNNDLLRGDWLVDL